MKIKGFAVLCILAVLSACSTNEEYAAGEKDSPDTYGVYFPTQDNPLAVELAPEDPAAVSYKIRRTRTDGRITVPVVISVNDGGIFSVEPVIFKDGENESTITF